jgi:hypothetical protein
MNHKGRTTHEQGVAVSRSLAQDVDADIAAAARPVIDDDSLAEALAERCCDRACRARSGVPVFPDRLRMQETPARTMW